MREDWKKFTPDTLEEMKNDLLRRRGIECSTPRAYGRYDLPDGKFVVLWVGFGIFEATLMEEDARQGISLVSISTGEAPTVISNMTWEGFTGWMASATQKDNWAERRRVPSWPPLAGGRQPIS